MSSNWYLFHNFTVQWTITIQESIPDMVIQTPYQPLPVQSGRTIYTEQQPEQQVVIPVRILAAIRTICSSVRIEARKMRVINNCLPRYYRLLSISTVFFRRIAYLDL